MRFDGQEVTTCGGAELKALRSRMQIIFQDPYASLNPRMSVGDMLGEALYLHGIGDRRDRRSASPTCWPRSACPAMPPGVSRMSFPEGNASASASRVRSRSNPNFIVADEPVSALDVSIQAQIINLLQDLRRDMRLSILFIGHDLSVVEYLCDRIIVLYLGRVMESGRAADLYARPRHPYTRALLDAAPVTSPRARRQRVVLRGDPPSPIDPPSGCVFRTRCPFAVDACASVVPEPVSRRRPAHRSLHPPRRTGARRRRQRRPGGGAGEAGFMSSDAYKRDFFDRCVARECNGMLACRGRPARSPGAGSERPADGRVPRLIRARRSAGTDAVKRTADRGRQGFRGCNR